MNKTLVKAIFLIFFIFPLSIEAVSANVVANEKQNLINSLKELIKKLEIELNALISLQSNINTPPIQSINNFTSVVSGVASPETVFVATKPTDLFITSLSLFNVAPGSVLTVKGHGFLKNNKFYIGSSYSVNVSASNNSFDVVVPNLPQGIYEVRVENDNGTSQNVSPMYIKISSLSLLKPIIDRVYPSSITPQTKVTVEGRGFDSTGNDIVSSLGVIRNLPAIDGKITFYVKDFPEAKKITSNTFLGGMVSTFSVKTSRDQSANFGRLVFDSGIVRGEENFFDKVFSFFGKKIKYVFGAPNAFAYGRSADGDVEGTQGIDETCSCSGGTILKFSSILDQGGSGGGGGGGGQDHYYLDYPGVTTSVGSQGGGYSSGNHYLSTIYPIGACLVIKGDYCESSSNYPEGTLNILGTAIPSKSETN